MQYLELFKESNFSSIQDEEQRNAKIQKSIDEYATSNRLGILLSSTLVFGQFFKILFNIFGETYVPSDKWTITEFITAIVNITTFLILSFITVEDIKSSSRKQNYDILVIFVVVFTWMRFFSYFLVIKGLSRHFITIYKMVKQTIAFIIVVGSVLLFECFVFILLFKDFDSNQYGNIFLSLRQMNDYMNGNYNRSTEHGSTEQNHLLTEESRGSFYWIHSQLDAHIVFTILHLFLSKILLINYIIALLMTVYNSMLEKGDFAYKSNRYEYIERYQIALSDGWGYSELVTTPAPLNIFMVVIIPWVFNRPSFKKAADIVGKIFFWLENIAYVLCLILYCYCLIPIIFVKFIINIYKNLPFHKFMFYLIIWIMFGLIYLLILTFVDLFNFIKILSDYRDDASHEEKKKFEELQDKCVLYNEILECVRTMYKITRQVREEKRYVKVKDLGEVYNPMEDRSSDEEIEVSLIFFITYFRLMNIHLVILLI